MSYTEMVEVVCSCCGYEATAMMLHENGGHFLLGKEEEGCPHCGGDWDDARTVPVWA